MISLHQAGKHFGPRTLFEDVSWLITAQDRIGLVGANGTGKTTLLKILAGLETLDKGERNAMRGVAIGYLPQFGLEVTGRTVFDECLSVFASLRAMEQEIESLTRQIAETPPGSPGYGAIAERFHQLDTEFRNRGGFALEAQVGAVLSGLGFPASDWKRDTGEFSGGWQMRIALAKLLLARPHLLLLDEPTNHLDLEARNWLEDYLQNYPHAFILVSHDRYFLDVTVKKIVELWNQRVHFYVGNYSRYLQQRAERRAQLESARKNQQDKIRQLETFVERFRYKATKARQVQSRIKELERMERIEIPEEEEAIHFSFPQPPASGRMVAEFQDVSKRYGDKEVFHGVSFVVERGDRVALVGPNGAGKSTLIKLFAGVEPPTSGLVQLGHNVEVDYFAQDQYKELDPATRMIDDLATVAPRATQTELRSLLGCFLFSADDVFKPIGVLSGGERGRYALARMLLHPSNFLLMDEPTNHLDMRAKDVLLRALEDFTGTVIFVSHDRYFIDRLATKVFEIGGGQVQVFPGNYEDYAWRKERMKAAEAEASAAGNGAKAAAGPQPAAGPENETLRRETRPRRINPIRLRQMEERVAELEDLITRAEADLRGLETELATFRSAAETQRLSHALEERRREVERLTAEWETLSAEWESAKG